MAEQPSTEPSLTDVVWEKLSSRLEGTSQTVQKIKFGRGAVGKISVIAVAAVIAVGAMAVRIGANAVYMGIGAVSVIALGSFVLIGYIVCKRPELAVMEGAELVMYQHAQLAAKGLTPNPSDRPGPKALDVDSAPRQIEDGQM